MNHPISKLDVGRVRADHPLQGSFNGKTFFPKIGADKALTILGTANVGRNFALPFANFASFSALFEILEPQALTKSVS